MHLLRWDVVVNSEDQLRIRLERDTNVTIYAILSHRRGNPTDEVSFEDMLNGTHEGKVGYSKLLGCCKQARKDRLRHVWIDTCCINKASSAELSEAITSMYTYYERSKVCYAFLDDFAAVAKGEEDFSSSDFALSAWFTRGWTLQELVAPQNVKFFDYSWYFLGYKTDKSLSLLIESITGIDLTVLNIPATTKLVSVAKRMSWAARRKTTRVEDMAYSLMGIFGVYMSPLYGEGHHAFIRLQEAIMKYSNDHTIFAWTSPPSIPLTHGLELVSTMLALSPDQFEWSAKLKSIPRSNSSEGSTLGENKLDYTITNAGRAIRLPLSRVPQIEGLYAAFLACSETEDGVPAAILLRTTSQTPASYFWRTNCNEEPIERSRRLWFPIKGRDMIESNDLYIFCRFSSISGDNIEPSWGRAEAVQHLEEKTVSWSLGAIGVLPIHAEVLNGLHHIVDPSFRELDFLRQAYQMMSTNREDQLINMIKTSKQHISRLLPFARNRNFTGRAAVLQELRDAFFPLDRTSTTQVKRTRTHTLAGLAGTGKTEVAREFSYHCLENDLFEAVIWVNAQLVEQGSSPDENVRAVLRYLSDLDEQRDILGSSSSCSAQWLLVFDHVEDPDLLYSFRPSSGRGCELIVGRDQSLWFDVGVTGDSWLAPLSIQESSELFRKLTKKDWDFAAASRNLGGLPLAVVQAAGFIVKADLSLEEFHRNWSDTKLRTKSSAGDVVWRTAILGITPPSRAMLHVMFFLDADFIEDSILIPTQRVPLEGYPPNESALFIHRSELLRLALIRRLREKNGVQIHTLVQGYVKGTMDANEFQMALATAVSLVSFAWQKIEQKSGTTLEPNKVVDLDEFGSLLPHVTRLGKFESEMKDVTESGLSMHSDFLKVLKHAKDYSNRRTIRVGAVNELAHPAA